MDSLTSLSGTQELELKINGIKKNGKGTTIIVMLHLNS